MGESWRKENGTGGYDLMMLRLTSSAFTGSKPALFVTGAVHAREYTTAELVTRFAEHLVETYDADADTTWLLDHHEVHLMTMVNPDGRKHAEGGVYWRKNDNTNHCPDDRPGVDLNRNFDFAWGGDGSSGDACSNTYRGTAGGSEPETLAVMQYMQDLFPDARGTGDDDAAPLDTGGVYIDVHSAGGWILYPWGYVSAAAPNGVQLRTLARKQAFFSDYWPDSVATALYLAAGLTQDYAYGALGRASFTYELGTKFFESCDDFEEKIVPGNIQSLLYAFKVARTPYRTPAGPEALDVEIGSGASSVGVPPGTTVTLSATLDDGRFSDINGTEPVQNIAAGEYYVDVPPWGDNPSSASLSAADGAFDESLEDVEASIDTTGWTPGRHMVFVRGRDTDGNWGAVGAAFLIVEAAAPPPPPPPPRNRAPVVAETLPDRSLPVGARPLTLDVASAFRDPDDDALTYAAESSAVDVAAVAVAGSLATVTPVSAGEARVTVTATDPGGSNRSAAQSFAVTVTCTYTVAPLHRDVLWTAETGQVGVTTTPGCAWTATSESDFLTVTGGAEGTGSGTVSYAVAANAGGPRSGALTVADHPVTVFQASPTQFTDHPIDRGVTPVKAIHFLELRARIDALRVREGLAAFEWTGPALTPGVTPVRGVHLTELRAALAVVYAALGQAAPTWTAADPADGAVVRAAHLMELRAAVAALE